MPSPALLIFDCDGVLVDSERLAHEVLLQMLAEAGVVLALQQAFDRFMGASAGKLLAPLHDAAGAHRTFRHMAELPALLQWAEQPALLQ